MNFTDLEQSTLNDSLGRLIETPQAWGSVLTRPKSIGRIGETELLTHSQIACLASWSSEYLLPRYTTPSQHISAGISVVLST